MPDNDATHSAVAEVARRQERSFYGKFRGVVTDNKDPDKQGRVQAQVPELFGDQPTGWAMACVPYAPAGKGFLILPEVGDNVWIEFEAGNPAKPVWAGAFWPQGQAPSVSGPEVKVIQTKAGHKITLDDTDGGEIVEILDKGGATISLSDQGIELKKGGMKVQITESEVSINDGALKVT
ncbi:phage baseplate assembly protein V [Tundrisphaera lichenicola]|uniref:phage baseplate assembly protein V n=1 Tax=Tundrisphaera lichenicola TaxID=2029860 RepID=UPI003EBD8AD8